MQMAQPAPSGIAQAVLCLRILGACAVSGLWIYTVFILWITRDLATLDAEPGDDTTWVVVLLLAAITAFALGTVMILVQPKPRRTPYTVAALFLMITGAVPLAVLLAL